MTEGISNGVDAASGAVSVGGITDTEIVGRVLAGDRPLYGLIMRRYNRCLFRLVRSIVQDDDEARDVVQAAYISAYYHLGQFRGPAGFRAWLSRITINEACALRGVEQLSVTETAELLDIKPATVKTRFHRARRLLQQSLRRKLNGTAAQAFSFDGQRCNAILTVSSRAQDRVHDESPTALENAVRIIARGRNAFRFNNFGNEDFWGGALRLHEAIKGAAAAASVRA